MNKIFKSAMFFAAAVTLGLTSCGSDDDNNNVSTTSMTSNSYLSRVEQMIDGCIDIANEVGTAKIGEPVDLWNAGDRTKALYAVESWYSWHSRDDYKNNILSIANSLAGSCLSQDEFLSITNLSDLKNSNSLIYVAYNNAATKNDAIDVWDKTLHAWAAIDAIPQPFRNNIGSDEAAEAMEACASLNTSLESLKGKIENLSEEQCKNVVVNFVDAVVMPTYQNLVAKNQALLAAVTAFQANPSNDTFASACEAWLAARQPWETSEAFLFGPVSDMGLDPNMDSWPLDADGIYQLLKSQQWAEMQWNGDYDENSKAIEAAQALRGFHTLEYLLFKDGQPRTIGGTNSDPVNPQELNYSDDLADAWGNYAVNVARLLNNDSNNLYKAWNSSYANAFKSKDASSIGY